ncbi:MAG: hypothetical protein ABSA75_11710 [Candidatus Bathyarchaeia archaeon]|jgi:hypothetical protein
MHGQLVVVEPEYLETNLCGAFLPEAYVREWLRQKLTAIDFVFDGTKDADQDQYLLQKPRR